MARRRIASMIAARVEYLDLDGARCGARPAAFTAAFQLPKKRIVAR
jgi:hypothetical protein